MRCCKIASGVELAEDSTLRLREDDELLTDDNPRLLDTDEAALLVETGNEDEDENEDDNRLLLELNEGGAEVELPPPHALNPITDINKKPSKPLCCNIPQPSIPIMDDAAIVVKLQESVNSPYRLEQG
jgi:hypothetical protein